MLGVAYKKNIDDMRESPAIEIIERLLAAGAVVDYCDPHVPRLPRMRHHELDLSSTEFLAERIAQSDCVVIATDHDAFDYELISDHARLIVDTRGRYSDSRSNVVSA